jgi:hypothetical protein
MTTVADEMTGAAIEAVWDAVKADNRPMAGLTGSTTG